MNGKGEVKGQTKVGYIVEIFYKLGIWSKANSRCQQLNKRFCAHKKT